MLSISKLEAAAVGAGVALSMYNGGGLLCLLDFIVGVCLQNNFLKNETLHWYRKADPGLWCSLMFPCILNLLGRQDFLSSLFVPLSYLCCMLIYARLWEKVNIQSLLLSVYIIARFTTVLWSTWRDLDGVTCILGLAGAVVYSKLLYIVPQTFPGSFTFGEACISSQLYIALWNAVATILLSTQDVCALQKLIFCVFVSVHVAVVVVWVCQYHNITPTTLWACLVGAGLACVGFTAAVLGVQQGKGLLQELFFEETAVCLLIWWSGLVILSVVIVCFYGQVTVQLKPKQNRNPLKSANKYQKIEPTTVTNEQASEEESAQELKQYSEIQTLSSSKTAPSKNDINPDTRKNSCSPVSTATRKYFHLAMLLVYFPGLVFHPKLLYLASVVATGVLVLIEYARYSQFPGVGSTLHTYLSVFLDPQDQGEIILTPIYLILGCSLPLWISYSTVGVVSLPCFAGLLSIGVGDSAASIVGKHFGIHKLDECEKSYEGTLASVIFQLVAFYGLFLSDVADTSVFSPGVVLVVMLNACLEASTKQIDNLVVPLFTFMTMIATVK
ncbi:uncharacterized protein LOC128226614 isoform X1 [Mya arenaria]|uniref:uncharacterized protein LOC128226614 isoform X1 n=1 Tax=Mya arenaria TaxID=6604 RepID=UPI0022E43F13|nr:uncharacterized protein LOC128226614 isoform X1 [Mya arenaria]XP_052792534.1 uncharacterized protein LOC128226614 isoform X1 [Mya arenaria]XP_052792535.1 uncharacterized protein LOC128226614 isoform X1 [Mya arenaria]